MQDGRLSPHLTSGSELIPTRGVACRLSLYRLSVDLGSVGNIRNEPPLSDAVFSLSQHWSLK